jgi:hypothetical protein
MSNCVLLRRNGANGVGDACNIVIVKFLDHAPGKLSVCTLTWTWTLRHKYLAERRAEWRGNGSIPVSHCLESQLMIGAKGDAPRTF